LFQRTVFGIVPVLNFQLLKSNNNKPTIIVATYFILFRKKLETSNWYLKTNTFAV